MATSPSDRPIQNHDVKRKARIDSLKLDFQHTTQTAATLALFGHGTDFDKGGALWFDTTTNLWKVTFNNGVITTLTTSSTSTTLDAGYTSGATINVTSANPVVLGNAQTDGTATLDINQTGDVAGAATLSLIDIDFSNQTGTGVKTAIDIAFGTEGSAGTHRGVLVATTIDTEYALYASKGSIVTADGYLSIVNTENTSTATATITNNTKSTGGNVVEISATGITTGTILKLAATEATISTGYYFACYDGAANDFTIGRYGATVVAGTAYGTASLTQTAGDHVITDGRLRVTSTNTTGSMAAGTAPVTITEATTTGDGFYINGKTVSIGTAFLIEIDASTMGSAGRAIQIWEHDGDATIWSVDDHGAMVVGSQAAPTTNFLTCSSGSIGLTAGNLVLTSGAVSITTVDTTGSYGGGSTNAAVYIDGATLTTAYALRIDVHDAVMTTGKAIAVTCDNVEVWGISKTGAQSFTSAVNIFDLNSTATNATSMFDIDYTGGVASGKTIDIVTSNLAHTLTAISVDIGGSLTIGATAFSVDASSAHTTKIINVDSSGVMADDTGCVEIDHSTGVLIAGSSLLRVDSDAVLTNAAALVNISMSAGTASYALWVESGAVARTSSLVKIDDAGTSTGASLYVGSASASTAKIVHVVPSSASFTGNAVYIDVGTASQHCAALYVDATSGHTSNCIYITSTGVLADNKAVLNIEHAGVIANAGGAVVRIVEGAVDVTTGSLLEVDAGATATGVYAISVIGGAAVRTSALVNIADATSSTGASLNVAVTGTSQTNAVLFAISNVAGTGNLLKLDVGGATTIGETALAIDASSAHTVQTINLDTSGIVADNVGVVEIDHSTGEIVAGGSLLRVDSDKALANACALVNIDMSAATAAYALWIEGGAAARTSDLVKIDDSTSNSGHTLSIARVASSGNMINLSVGAFAYTGTAIAIDLGNAATTGAKAMTIDVTNLQTTDVIAITSSAVLANNLGVLNITSTGVMANDGAALIRVDSTAVQNVGGALVELTDNSASTAGAILRIAAPTGARTTDVVNITAAATVLAQDKALLNVIHTGVLAHDEAALIRVVNNSIQLRGAMLELQDAGASTAGSVLRISTVNAIRTGDVVTIADTSTGSSDCLSITESGAGSGSLINLVVGAVAYTGTVLAIDIGDAATVAAQAITINATNAQTTDVVAITTTALLANNKAVLNIINTGIMANDGAALIRVDSTAVQTAGALLELTDNSASTTNAAILRVASAGARTADVVNITTAACALAQDHGIVNINHTGVMGHAEAALIRVVNNSIQTTGAMLELQDAGASTGSNIIKITDAGAARTGDLISITSVSTSTSNAISISSSGAGYTGYGLYINNTTGEAIHVHAGVCVFDEKLTVTGTTILGANTIYVRSDAAGIISFTTADAAPAWNNTAQVCMICRNVTDADMVNVPGATGEIVFNTTDTLHYGCKVGSATNATWGALNA